MKHDSAFPILETAIQTDGYNGIFGNTFSTGGCTKRELFAMAAMQGFCANPEVKAWSKHEVPKGYAVSLEGASLAKADLLIAEIDRVIKSEKK